MAQVTSKSIKFSYIENIEKFIENNITTATSATKETPEGYSKATGICDDDKKVQLKGSPPLPFPFIP